MWMPNSQVYIVQLQLLQAQLDGGLDVSEVAVDLGRDKQLLAGHAALLDGQAQLGLRLVHLGAIEVGVTELDGHLGRLDQAAVDLRFIARLVPRCARAVAELQSNGAYQCQPSCFGIILVAWAEIPGTRTCGKCGRESGVPGVSIC